MKNSLFLGPIIGGMRSAPLGETQSVRLWGRAEKEGRLYAWVGERPDLSDALVPAAFSKPLVESDGFAGVVLVEGLQPDRRYFYAITMTARPPENSGVQYPSFRTFPIDKTNTPFNFAFGSCFLPSYGIAHGAKSAPVFDALDQARESQDLRFSMMIGDQIYADDAEHNGLGKIAESVKEYRAAYKHAWSYPALEKVFRNLPVYMAMDDHEVDDDWHWNNFERKEARIPRWDSFFRWLKGIEPRDLSRTRVLGALQAFREHQVLHAPELIFPPLIGANPLCYAFTFGGAAFFVLDTRTRRVFQWFGDRTVLGERQWKELERWLLTVKDAYPVKFIVSSSAMLMRYFYDVIYDRWGAYPVERKRLVNFIAENDIQGVHILSGDVHSAHAVEAELAGSEGQPILVREFCSSPFSQKTEWYKRYGFDRRRFGRVTRLRKLGSVTEPNFGLVRVGYTDLGHPDVSYEIYDQRGARVYPDPSD